MEDRLRKLEQDVGRIARRLEQLEIRLSRLESGAVETRAPEDSEAGDGVASTRSDQPSSGGVAGALALAGRTCLVLGGAFLVRGLTDAGAVPRPVGVTLGLAYALIWLLYADREGRRDRELSAAFSGMAGIAIAYPLVWEACTRFHVFSPLGAAGALAVLTAAALAVAWRLPGQFLSWGVTLSALTAGFALLAATSDIQAVAALLILLGLATGWLAYARRWPGPRWPGAAGADFVVLLMTSLASRPEGPPEAYRGLSVPVVLTLALLLPVAYLATFSARTLSRQREVTAFEALQAVIALLVGFGGAVRVANTAGIGTGVLGACAAGLGVACYAVALGFTERLARSGRNFFFFTTIALLLTLSGSAVCSGGLALAVFWSLLAVAATALGNRVGRTTLLWHGAIFAVAAALHGGLLGATSDAFTASAGAAWRPLGAASIFAAAAAGVSYAAIASLRGPASPPLPARLPALAFALLFVAGAGALSVDLLATAVPAGGPAGLATLRTAVLSAAAAGLAAAGRQRRLAELSWLVYPVLLLAGFKLLAENLSRGTPLTIAADFALYGSALIVAPRLLRKARSG